MRKTRDGVSVESQGPRGQEKKVPPPSMYLHPCATAVPAAKWVLVPRVLGFLPCAYPFHSRPRALLCLRRQTWPRDGTGTGLPEIADCSVSLRDGPTQLLAFLAPYESLNITTYSFFFVHQGAATHTFPGDVAHIRTFDLICMEAIYCLLQALAVTGPQNNHWDVRQQIRPLREAVQEMSPRRSARCQRRYGVNVIPRKVAIDNCPEPKNRMEGHRLASAGIPRMRNPSC